jgi:lipopolysaccharide export system ATP-binding protein
MSLLASGLVKTYSHRKIVDDVEIEINPGEIVGLLGPNGAGKTTTFYMIVGLLRPDRGRIFLEGKDVTELPMYKRARQGIGYLSQEPSIFRRLSVRENIWAILETTTLTQSEKKEWKVYCESWE